MLPAILGGLTWRQSAMYVDSETLYRTTLARNPASWMGHNNLGTLLLQVPGRRPEAIAEFQAALRIDPDYVEAHNNLGLALAQTPNGLPEAISEYQAALRIQPDNAEAHDSIGAALMDPAFARTTNNLDGLDTQQKRMDAARQHWEYALGLRRQFMQRHPELPPQKGIATELNNLGFLDRLQNRTEDARKHYEEALNVYRFNMLNHVNYLFGTFGAISAEPTPLELGQSGFGFPLSARPPREIQFALKFYF